MSTTAEGWRQCRRSHHDGGTDRAESAAANRTDRSAHALPLNEALVSIALSATGIDDAGLFSEHNSKGDNGNDNNLATTGGGQDRENHGKPHGLAGPRAVVGRDACV